MPANGRILVGGVLQRITRLPLGASRFRLCYNSQVLFLYVIFIFPPKYQVLVNVLNVHIHFHLRSWN